MARFKTPEEMLSSIVQAHDKAVQTIGADGIIRSGELFANILQNGITRIHRDTFHASLGIGRYALGLLWYRTLCDYDIVNNGFSDFDEPISKENINIIKTCVKQF